MDDPAYSVLHLLQFVQIVFGGLEEQLYSLEQYIGCIWRLAFIHYCGLHQVWLEAEN